MDNFPHLFIVNFVLWHGKTENKWKEAGNSQGKDLNLDQTADFYDANDDSATFC